ncbi:competence type IV pilus minor pilin ComGG [Neobacillus ginsengisoli]|uniref:Competence protein ComGG n=1 Tax=Neobacillus ginsengisoli TaxID=904295 RepID=A0ABT9XP49_9BACI|nr:competence type IV pilus minor pilin ComGG [Neobacillus ginsengisoli]MDQ0197313.1 competence protein ComGG [Neobacillus ginsengisoli]
MRKNEKGFTYPLTLCVLILFLLFFSSHVERLLTEKEMAHETALILQQDYYFLTTVKKIEKLYQSTGIQLKGSFKYINGKMDYQAETPIGTSQKISFTLRLNSGETVIGRGYFDIKLKRMVKWLEMN